MPAAGEKRQKGKIMEKIIFNNGTEMEIMEGAALTGVRIVANSFAELQSIADAVADENLRTVKFKSGESITGVYENMKLESPLFHVSVQGGKVIATISLRQKTEMELEIEDIKAGQEVQDGAIADVADVVSVIAEGGQV